MKRGIFVFLMALFFSILNASNIEAKELVTDSQSAIVIEQSTGTILYDKNMHDKLAPASMTKIMTMLLIMEEIDQGRLKLEDLVRTSEYAASMGVSQIFLEEGEQMTVEDMLTAISIASANDASVAMAEKIAGSEEDFVKKMNHRVKELGLKNTKFQNSTGLPVKNHYSTAYDMAIIAKELLRYEEITDFTKQYEAYLREDTDKKFWLVNTNKLVKFYPGVDGLKTGFTRDAMYCLTATAKKDDMRVITVVFGASTPKIRNAEITKLLDYAFSQFETKKLYEANEIFATPIVSKGKKKTVDLVSKEPVSLLIKKGEKIGEIKTELIINEKTKAPIKKGDELGKLVIKKKDEEVLSVPLVSKESVNKANWWELYKRAFSQFTQTY